MTNEYFDGTTYDPDRDGKRLTGQLWLVYDFVKDGSWHSLQEIAEAIKEPVPSVSTRLRDLRKKRFGSHTIERRHVKNGLHEYRLAAGPGIGQKNDLAHIQPEGIAVSTALPVAITREMLQQDPNIWAQPGKQDLSAFEQSSIDACLDGIGVIKRQFKDKIITSERVSPMEDLGALSPAQIEEIKYAGASPELKKFYQIQEKYGHGHHVKRLDGKTRCPNPDLCTMCQREISHIYYLKKKGEKTNA